MGEHLGEQDVANEHATVTARETEPNTTQEVDDVKRDFFGGYVEAFSEEFFQLLLVFRTFLPFSEAFQVRKQRAFYPIGHGKNEASTRFFLYLSYVNINNLKIVFKKPPKKAKKSIFLSIVRKKHPKKPPKKEK